MIKKIFSGLAAILFVFVTMVSVCAAEIRREYPHWNKPVISVYIPKDPYAASMRNAFMAWAGQTNGRVKFKFVPNGPADIDVVFTENASGDTPIATYSTKTNGLEITKAEIKLGTKNPNIKKYSKNYIYTTMLHEVGHTLGLSHKERKQTSIMYSPIDPKQEIIKYDVRDLYKINGWGWAQDHLRH